MRWITLALFIGMLGGSWLITGCGGKGEQKDTTKKDSTYVSDHFLSDTTPTENTTEFTTNTSSDDHHSSHHSSHSYSSSDDYSGGGGGSRSSGSGQAWSSKYQNYQRSGTSDKDFAEAMVWHVIRMVYDEEFRSAKSKVLDSKTEGGVRTINLEVVWSDEWVKNYTVAGTLTVNEDGSNAQFAISSKNKEAELLEFTHEDTKSELQLDAI